jgi:hypothetical protein
MRDAERRPNLPAVTPRVAQRRRQLAIRLTAAALTWGVGLLLSALVLPVYNGQTIVDANGLTLTTATYVQRNGAWVLVGIGLPAVAAVAAGLAIARPGRRAARWAWLAVGLTWAVGLVTVVNAGGLLLVAAVLTSLALRLVAPRTDTGRRGKRRPERRRRPEREAEAS